MMNYPTVKSILKGLVVYNPAGIIYNRNPKGPETGEIKVIRRGGFWNADWKCRSACRLGDPPENKGAGLSFRLAKDE